MVRLNSRTPSRSSSERIVWLMVGKAIPTCAAALVKRRCSATATKAVTSRAEYGPFFAAAAQAIRSHRRYQKAILFSHRGKRLGSAVPDAGRSATPPTARVFASQKEAQMEQEITVAPITTGWTLKCTEVDHEIYFRSGADAEAAARNLGAKLARAGATVVIQIFVRDGAVAGRYVLMPEQLSS